MKALILDGDEVKASHDWADVAKAVKDKTMFWVELDEETPEADTFLKDELHIHPLAVEDLWHDVGLPKVEDFGDYIQVIVHGVKDADRNQKRMPLELAELDLLIGKNFLVSHANDEKTCAVTPTQDDVHRNPKLLKKGPAWVAHALLDRLVDEYMPLVDHFDEKMQHIEDKILVAGDEKNKMAPADKIIVPAILRVKRSLQVLRRTTIYQREILLRLARADFDEIPREAAPFFRDVYDHYARVTELVDSYRELVTSLLEAHLSLQSNRMNEVMKRLTVISTVMLPLTVIAGIYGMNFEHMPELKWQYGYPMAIGLMVLVAGSIIGWFKAKKWI